MAPQAPPRSIKARALQLLSQREHSRVELRRKLLPAAIAMEVNNTPEDSADPALPSAMQRVDAVLDWLEANKHLSDQRFAESRVHARASRFGNRRIGRELALNQVSLPPGLELELKETELERARAVWARKFPAAGSSPAERARQGRFLAGRGFSAEVIHRLLRETVSAPESDGDMAAEID